MQTRVFNKMLLAADHPLFRNADRLPTITGLPEGKVRVRVRPAELVVAAVKCEHGFRCFYVTVTDDNALSAGPEIAANYRQTSPPASAMECGADPKAAEAEAQAAADATGKKWVWFADESGRTFVKPADVLHHVQLNDVVLAGEIVVLERPSRKEVYHLVWPRLPRPAPSDTVPA